MSEVLWMVGRACIGALFIAGALHHCFAFAHVSQQIADRGIAWPRVLLAVGSVWQAGAGLLLVLGMRTFHAAAALVVFTTLASLMLLDFWNREGAERTAMLTSWRSNVAIIGGLLVTMAHAGGG